jgi:integrase
MNKVNAETAAKMMQLIDRTTYQGRIIYLAIAFIQQTRLEFADIARLRVRDVYGLGIVRITLQVGFARDRIVALNGEARQIVADILKAQAAQGLQPYPWCSLFRTPSGRPFSQDELARLFWVYREAAEMTDAS